MNKLTINVHGKPGLEDKKTAALPSRKVRKLGRRRINPGPFLRVFDLGQLAGGTDVDLHYASVLTGGGFFTFSADGQDGGNNATWNDDLLAVDYNDWADTYQEISDSLATYVLTIGDMEFVPGKGLRSPSGETSVSVTATQNKYFPLWSSSKITNTTTYSDPGVTFTFDKNTDLFLAPMMFSRNGYARTTAAGMFTDDFFIYFKAPLSREATVNDATWDSIWSKRTNASLLSPSEITAYRNHLLSDQNPLEYRFTYLAIDPGPTPHAYSTNPATDFPTEPDEPSWVIEPYIDLEPAAQFEGKLIAAFRKHISSEEFEWYFLWATSTWPLGTTGWDLRDVVV